MKNNQLYFLYACILSLLLVAIGTLLTQRAVQSNQLPEPRMAVRGITTCSTPSSPYIDPLLFFNTQVKHSTPNIQDGKKTIFMHIFRNIRNFSFEACNFNNCWAHNDTERIQQSDAVVVAIVNVQPATFSRGPINPDKPWIFFSLEPPPNIGRVIPNWHSYAFNWSWTYRRDSDIFNSYGLFQTNVLPSFKNYTDIYKRKTKFAAWFVSHCHTQSKREDYVKLLQKYVNVDIFGKCGNDKSRIEGRKDILKSGYKFYLGFENSLCEDYITEKYFMTVHLDLIVVVRGGSDYVSLLPNKTYVNTADFSSIQQLANFLLRLGSDEEEYISYLKRKDQFKITSPGFAFKNAMCHLCEKLNRLESNRKPAYPSVTEWTKQGQCRQPQDLF